MCGRVIGYQYHSTDAFGHDSLRNDIDTSYVDGVSITHGSPHQHVWTYACGIRSDYSPSNTRAQCPCNSNGQPDYKPDFVGGDYYCESGNPNNDWEPVVYRDDPLWDNHGCGALETKCCNTGLLPYFYKHLGDETTDDIEFKICADQGNSNEDVRVSIIELYIR